MYSLISYIRFLLLATNQHGVHSPFVYAYVTKCLYAKKTYSKNKTNNALLKSIAYFNSESIKINKENTLYKNYIKKHFPDVATKTPQYDVIYLAEPKTWNSTVKNKEIKNTTMVCIHGIHKDRKANSQWNTIKELEEVTVSIDLFYCGILFFRKEQVKEHFKIRC